MKIVEVQIPNTIHEALSHLGCKKVVYDKIGALKKTGTWEIVDLPRGKNIVCCKWIFIVKHRVDISIKRLNARLVAKGFTQAYSVDCRLQYDICPPSC